MSKNIEKIYPLAPMQEGMLFHSLKDKDSDAYFEQISVELTGDIDINILEASFNKLIQKYDILRSSIAYEDLDRPRQVVLKERKQKIYFADISNKENIDEYIAEFKAQDKAKGFDLTTDHLLRMSILKKAEAKYQMIFSFHHIIMDGWCSGIIFKELFENYRRLNNNQSVKTDTAYQYKDYIDWLQNQDEDKARQYWADYLDGYNSLASLPQLEDEKNKEDYQKEEVSCRLSKELTAKLKKLANDNQVTLNTIFQAAWGLVLQRYNNTDEVVFGTVVSGRTSEVEGIEEMIGLFINTIPVKIKTEAGMNFNELITKVQKRALLNKEYSYYPLAKIQSVTELKDNLLDHIMVFENYPIKQANFNVSDDIQLDFNSIELFEQTNYDFNIMVTPKDELTIKFNFNSAIYNKELVENISEHLTTILTNITQPKKVQVDELGILPTEETNKLLQEFNATQLEYPQEKTIHELFAEQAAKTPNKIAAVYKEKQITYQQLNQRANQLARVLRTKGVSPDDLVGVMMGRSIKLLIGILAILKAGAAYVPIDCKLPAKRKNYILKDSQAQMLLTTEKLYKETDLNYKGKVTYIEAGADRDNSNLPQITKAANLIYSIYTSGTTGKPKGVLLEHRNLVNLISSEHINSDINFGSKVLQFASMSFDVCYQEIFATLLSGGRLYIAKEENKKDINQTLKFISKEKIKILFLPTAYLKLLASSKEYLAKLPTSVERIITAGEQLIISQELADYCKEKKINISNHYGPSETHVVTTYDMDYNQDMPEVPPIGNPIANTDIYIVDQNNKLQPIGITGELCIAGDSIGRGYLNREELNNKKFIDNPFGFGKMYKTGDLARWLPEGNIEFLGRIDHQVQIRGHRVELGEVESKLVNHPAIKEAAVVAKEERTSKYLAAYIVGTKELKMLKIRDYLAAELPDYMVPTYMMQLKKLPLNQNGKVDREALPEPEGKVESGVEYIAPRNEREEKLVELGAQILGVEQLGINDNFFNLGGTSLSIMQLAQKIKLKWQVELPISEIYAEPTIRKIAAKIKKLKNKNLAAAATDEVAASKEKIKPKEHKPAKVEKLSLTKEKPKNILLTGATGFLGSHLLQELIKKTEANIYCLLRKKDFKSLAARLKEKLNFYFATSLDNYLGGRIITVEGDLTAADLGIEAEKYKELADKIDTIIHTAADVRHHGQYENFKEINVLGTKRLLELCSVGREKKFHHTSTLSVIGADGNKDNFTESDLDIGQKFGGNVYSKSKFEAEKLVHKARAKGLEASIYRVGLLVGRYKDGVFQKNIGENRFYNHLKGLILLGKAPTSYLVQQMDLSPIDKCSQAMVDLILWKDIIGHNFHLMNPNLVSMQKIIAVANQLDYSITEVADQEFSSYAAAKIKQDTLDRELSIIFNDLITADNEVVQDNAKQNTMEKIDTEFTMNALEQLGFEWPIIDDKFIKNLLQYCEEVGYITKKD